MNIQQTEKFSPVRTIKRLLGRILLDGEFVSSQDLEKALERQKQVNSQIGEILIGMGVLDPADLNAVLSIQKELSTLDQAIKVGAGVRLLLGELLVKAKRITEEQLSYALREQHRTSEKLGDLLVRLGLLMEHERDVVLAFQRHQRGEEPGLEKLRLGEILVTTGQITRDQLEEALKQQKISNRKIGELLIAAGYVKPSQIEHCLRLQQKLVTVSLIAALSLSNMIAAQETHASSTSAKVTITASVREQTTMQVLNQVHELIVTHADIGRGYVEVPGGSRINVKTNNRAGCLLALEVMDDPGALFNSVFVRIGGREVKLSSSRGWIQQPYFPGSITEDVTYRFTLSKDAQPGTYNWPLAISVLPLGH